MAKARGRTAEAADATGLSPRTLRNRLKACGLRPGSSEAP
jgi:DNA-binding NtrC family response regulator